MNLYPAILTENSFTLQEQIDLVSDESTLPVVQIDVIDGEFVDNLTISPIDLIGTNFYDLQVDFHLMVNEPIEYVYECSQLEQIRTLIGQIEHMSSQADFIQEVKERNMKPGLSLDLYTPISSIDKESWQEISLIQLMGIQAGFQGQEFKGLMVLDKVKALVKLRKELDQPQLEIVVDGGVKFDNIDSILKAGADGVAVGSELWKSSDFNHTVSQLVG